MIGMLFECMRGAQHRRSSNALPIICNPTGKPSANPQGTLIAGTPAKLTGIVQISFKYIVSGSPTCSPIRNAGRRSRRSDDEIVFLEHFIEILLDQRADFLAFK